MRALPSCTVAVMVAGLLMGAPNGAHAANQPPELLPIPDQFVDELQLLTFTAVASDPDQPAQTLRFRFGGGSLTGAALDPATGVFTWRPTEANGPSVTPFSIIVTDDGSPSMSATQVFHVTVREVNLGPHVVPIPDQTVNEGELLVVLITGTDPDVPVQRLTFSLDAGAPPGAAITEGGFTEGKFTWTPDELQGPGTYVVRVVVSDNATPSLMATQSFSITVNEVNFPPEVPPIPEQTVNEGQLLSFRIEASDRDRPSQSLTFSLGAGGPAGATVDPNTGVFSWTPQETDGPGRAFFSVRVTDNGSPPLTTAQGFAVTVNEVNRPPDVPPIPQHTVNEGQLLLFDIDATDPDFPPQILTRTLAAGAPAGANVSPGGLFTWTPNEAQGPGTFTMRVIVTDSGVPSLSVTQQFVVVVNEVNFPPVVPSIPEYSVDRGELLTFPIAASDPDLPAQRLTFELGAGAPANASLDPVTGVFSWTPPQTQGLGRTFFSMRVTDNGSPPLTTAQGFVVTVGKVNHPPEIPLIGDRTIDQGELLTFSIVATDPDLPAQGLTFSLGANPPAGATLSPAGSFRWTPGPDDVGGTHSVIVIVTDTGQPPLSATNSFQIFVTGGSLVSPRLENAEFSGNVFSARVDSLAGRTYFLEFNPSLTAGDWRLVGQFPGDGTRLTLTDLNATNTSGFYRARVQ